MTAKAWDDKSVGKRIMRSFSMSSLIGSKYGEKVRQDLVVEWQGIHHDGSLGPSHEGKVASLSNHLAIPNAEHGFFVLERLVPDCAIRTAVHRTDPDQHVE